MSENTYRAGERRGRDHGAHLVAFAYPALVVSITIVAVFNGLPAFGTGAADSKGSASGRR